MMELKDCAVEVFTLDFLHRIYRTLEARRDWRSVTKPSRSLRDERVGSMRRPAEVT